MLHVFPWLIEGIGVYFPNKIKKLGWGSDSSRGNKMSLGRKCWQMLGKGLNLTEIHNIQFLFENWT